MFDLRCPGIRVRSQGFQCFDGLLITSVTHKLSVAAR
jgi:hypothetical protein